MKSRRGHLHVTYLGGRPKLARITFCRHGEKSLLEFIEVEPDMVLEIDGQKERARIRLDSPERASLEVLNRALAEQGFAPIDEIHLRPLRRTSEAPSGSNRRLTAEFENGRLWAAYLYLTERREKSAGSRRVNAEMIVDVNRKGDLIGIEFLAPVSYVDVHLLLMEYGLPPLPRAELDPVLTD